MLSLKLQLFLGVSFRCFNRLHDFLLVLLSQSGLQVVIFHFGRLVKVSLRFFQARVQGLQGANLRISQVGLQCLLEARIRMQARRRQQLGELYNPSLQGLAVQALAPLTLCGGRVSRLQAAEILWNVQQIIHRHLICAACHHNGLGKVYVSPSDANCLGLLPGSRYGSSIAPREGILEQCFGFLEQLDAPLTILLHIAQSS
mmetsp:Transcript_26386/g.61227  ORF Transcript_26386/g.61227 Transcript_26386/m.61227 type:complete len:201 (-) Transcript_26386:528-1130(-)